MELVRATNEQLDHVSIDIENLYTPLATSLRKELRDLHPVSNDCCIYKVPIGLHRQNEKAYTPQVVSIGPFHHGREELKPMEEHKRRYLHNFLQRTKASLESFLQLLKEKEARIRNCYAETFPELDSDHFVKIILVDAAFIIEVLLRCRFSALRGSTEGIFDRGWMIYDVFHDLCKLENQLPFFVLKDLFKLADVAVLSGENQIETPPNINVTREFNHHFRELPQIEDLLDYNSSQEIMHFVDYLSIYYQPSTSSGRKKVENPHIPSITELHRAGVQLKLGSSKNLFDIKLNNGVLEIPKVEMRDSTELKIRNLLAFEQCHGHNRYMTDYVLTFKRLVNTSKDVELLVQNGIIENMLEDGDAVSDLFQGLSRGIFANRDNFYFAALFEDLNVYHESSWKKWKANLKQNYFNTPWAIISVVAAVMLLLLTFIQTVCSMKQLL